MESIDFQHRTRLVFELHGISRLGELARQLGCGRALVVSDAGVVAAGHFQRGVDALRAHDVTVEAFLDVHENPSSDDVDAGVAVARRYRPDLLIGLGGGSSMDCAKGINFVYSCGGKMEDYWGVGKATGEMLPMIAVPTTAGTGSEAQSFALISHPRTHAKMACGDPRAACRIALLDPELTVTQPARVTALTGIDAISHALESYVCKRRNALSGCYSRQAWRMLSDGFPRVLRDPLDLEARSAMQLGAFFSGLAIETSMLGAAHALANPLTARYGVTHGQAVGVMLPEVIRYNAAQVEELYSDLWRDVMHQDLAAQCQRDSHIESLAEFVQRLVEMSGLASDLESLGVDANSIDELAEQASQQWTGNFNPRPVTVEALRDLYTRSLSRCNVQ
ncbi:MAG: iron-containing alcohol dehydrogenase [Planctomycetota bacterium]|nr:MAG: iron-containing alcohol dehydrogenase [Planctomycetota bacterium]